LPRGHSAKPQGRFFAFPSIFPIGEHKAKLYIHVMDGAMSEGRKRVLLIASSILAARRLAELDGKKPTAYAVAYETCISNAIADAEKILRQIDCRWPTLEKRGY
jgi:hypothetical protein